MEKETIVGREHWFDTLNTSLVRDGHRRGFLRAASALAGGLVFGTTDVTRGAKPKHKRRKRRKDRPDPPPPCSGGACAAEPEWVGNQGEIDHCEFICEQCDGDDPREFCIRDGTKPDGSPTKVADCCDEGRTCCGGSCCDRGARCCGGNDCCGSTDDSDLQCCDGRCINTAISAAHCGDCDNACGAGQVCRDGRCGCAAETCPQGQLCFDDSGQTCGPPAGVGCHCGCGPHFKYCPDHLGGACVSEHSPLC
ncbi:MAG: hypothetical protein ACRDJC_13235 [Thermomicrobiales bacterium]